LKEGVQEKKKRVENTEITHHNPFHLDARRSGGGGVTTFKFVTRRRSATFKKKKKTAVCELLEAWTNRELII
jgi:hypothetical protein